MLCSVRAENWFAFFERYFMQKRSINRDRLRTNIGKVETKGAFSAGIGLTTTNIAGPLRIPANVEALYAADSSFSSLEPARKGGVCATPAAQTLNCDLSKNEFTSCRASGSASIADVQCAVACKLQCSPPPPPPPFAMGTAGCGRAPSYQPDAGRSSQTKTITVGGVERTYLLHLSPAYDPNEPVAVVLGAGNPFLGSHFYTKLISLPRQARDKRRNRTVDKRSAFSADFHGWGMSSEAEEDWSGMSALSDDENFIVAYPHGNDITVRSKRPFCWPISIFKRSFCQDRLGTNLRKR